jgi:hypothetical protein
MALNSAEKPRRYRQRDLVLGNKERLATSTRRITNAEFVAVAGGYSLTPPRGPSRPAPAPVGQQGTSRARAASATGGTRRRSGPLLLTTGTASRP